MENNILYNWSFSNDKNRGNLWYVIALSIMIGIVVWWFLSRQYVLSFLAILIAGVYFFVENNSEEIMYISITPLGFKLNNTFYDYSKIRSFSLIYEGENAVVLRLNLIKKGLKYLDLPINNEIALALKEVLPNFLKEDENGELGLSDKVIKILKL